MIKKILYTTCLACTLHLHADYVEEDESLEIPSPCEESQSCEKKLSWQKFLLTTGLVVLSVATFTLVGIRGSK